MKLAWNSLILFGSFSFSIDFGSLCVSKSFCCFWSDFLFFHLEFDFYLYGFLLLWKVFCSFFNWVFFCFYRSFVTFNGISCFELFLILMEFDCNGVSLFCLGFLCFDWFPLEFADLLLVLGVSLKNFDTFDEFIIFFHVGFWLEFLALIYFLISILILTEFGWNSLNWFRFYFFQLTFVWFLSTKTSLISNVFPLFALEFTLFQLIWILCKWSLYIWVDSLYLSIVVCS